jgi:hypothetical protein
MVGVLEKISIDLSIVILFKIIYIQQKYLSSGGVTIVITGSSGLKALSSPGGSA